MNIKAAVTYSAGSDFKIENLQMEEPQDDEVLVKIKATGICHTDIAARNQYIPYPLAGVLGHEGSGVVVQIGSRVTKVKPGDHVAIAWSSCGRCGACLSGHPTHCPDFLRLNFGGVREDGTTYLSKNGSPIHGSFFGQSSFANYSIALERNIVKVPKDVPLEILGPLGCGVMTGAGAVMNSLNAKSGTSIAVFGTGTVGMSAIMAANIVGCTRIIAVDLNQQRLELAESLGATHVVNASKKDPVSEIKKITNGGPNYSLECLGNPKVFRQSVDVLPLMGVAGLVGVVAPGTEVSLNMDLIMNGRTIKGVIEGDSIPGTFIPKLIDLYKCGKLPFDRIIHYFPFKDINEAIKEMEQGNVIKPVLVH